MRYLSLLRYEPRASSDLAQKCKYIVRAIKNDSALAGGTLACEAVAQILVEQRKKHKGLRDVFDEGASLVPVPRSAPRSKDALWPSLRIAEALKRHNLGDEVLIAVERIKNIRASHTSGKDRPSVEEHRQTLKCCLPLNANPRRIVLVDDVITKGTTAWACREIIQDSIPGAEIVVFAAVSTERTDATLIGPIAIRDGIIQNGPFGPWRPDTKDPETWTVT